VPDKMWVPNANPGDTRKKAKPKKNGIHAARAIDEGTAYCVSGRLRRLIREIESGKLGEVRHCIVLLNCKTDDRRFVKTQYYGRGEVEAFAYMLAIGQKDVLSDS
jgi:hypothetical protein